MKEQSLLGKRQSDRLFQELRRICVCADDSLPLFIMRVLVTGGAGYIGSHATRALRRAVHDVIIFDNLSRGFRQLAGGFELIEADLLDGVAVQNAVKGVDAIMHFAALASVAESVEQPDLYFRNNAGGGMNLLNAARDAGVKLFV